MALYDVPTYPRKILSHCVMLPLKKRTEASATLAHLDYLDGWRGLAITFLLVGHFFPVPGINLGSVGVNLFFVLSGYLMGQLLFIKETRIPVFYKRRISRIVPAHLFFIICITGFFAVTRRPISWNETIAALFFVNNYFPGDPGHPVMPFGHIWSLSVEEHSYILLSLVAIVSRKKWLNAKWSVASLTVFFSATGYWYWSRYSGQDLYGKLLNSEVAAYGIFVSAFLLLFFETAKIRHVPSIVFPCLLSVGVLMHWWSIPSPASRTIGLGALALIVNLLFAAPETIKRILAFKPLKMMGIWSFSIYLWQQPFYLAVHRDGMHAYFAVGLAMTCGIASFYFLERPVRSYLNGVWGRPDEAQRTKGN